MAQQAQQQEMGMLSIPAWLSEDAGSWKKQMQVVRPEQLSCWTKLSAQQGGTILYGSTQGLGTFQQPQLPVDLNTGYPDCFIRKQGDSAPVEQVIGAIRHAAEAKQHNQQQASTDGESGGGGPALAGILSRVQVVTFRNNLNKIFGTLVHVKDEWTVDACLHEGVLYLDIVKTEEASFPNQDLMHYYGYKFETVCTRPDPAVAQDPSQPPLVDSTSEFATLVRLELEDVGVILAAEIDLMDSSYAGSGGDGAQHEGGPPPLASYLELKVHKPPGNTGQQRSLVSWKWPKWWLQSFLAGVPTLVLGSRDDAGLLTQVHRVEVQTLPAEARRQGASWDAWQMLRFGTHVLRWFRQCAAQQPDTHLRFHYCPGTHPVIRCAAGPPEGQLPERLRAALGHG